MRLYLLVTYFEEFRRSFYSRRERNQVMYNVSPMELVRERLDWAFDIYSYATENGCRVAVSILNDPISQCCWALRNRDAHSSDERRVLNYYGRAAAGNLNWHPE